MWPKRLDIQTFLKEGFVEGFAPDSKTIKSRILRGDIPGEVQGNRYYVWVGPDGQLMEPTESTGSTLADSMLEDWQHGDTAA